VLHSGGAGGQPEKPGAGHLFAAPSGMERFGRNPWAQSATRSRRNAGTMTGNELAVGCVRPGLTLPWAGNGSHRRAARSRRG
jgi:hypothetical protein